MSLVITANLIDLTGTDNVGWATFTLQNYGSSLPRISGAIISAVTCKALANGSGAISQAIIGNDAITPTGTTYLVSIFSNFGALISEGEYSLVGSGTVDLSTLTQEQLP